MYRIVYEEKRAIIQVNKAPQGFHELWDNLITAFTVTDIPKEIWPLLSEKQQESLGWFFFDMDERARDRISLDDNIEGD